MAEQLTPQTPDLEVWGSSPARRVVSLDKKLYSTFSPLTQVYKWVAATYPIQEGVAIFLGMLKAKETGISSGCLGPWHVCTFTLSEAKKSCLLPGAGGSCYQASEFCSKLAQWVLN